MTQDPRFKRILAGICLFLVTGLSTARAEFPPPVFFSYFKVYDWDTDYVARRFALAVWHQHPKTVRMLPELKKKNPDATALLYRELFCILKEETQLGESVGHYDWILENHPEWFQRDTRGAMIEIPHYPGRYMMDMGNEQWQEFWIAETLKDVRRGGWDGVFADDALTGVRMHGLPPLENYPADEDLQEAVYGFLKKIHDAFGAEGKLALANVSNSYDYPGLFARWLDVTDGIMEEHCSGRSWTWGDAVGTAQLQAMATAKKEDKWYLCMTYGSWDDQQLMDMSLSTYLMGAGGKVAWSYRPEKNQSKRLPVDPPLLAAAGMPLDQAVRVNGLWSRVFSGGTLYLNPAKNTKFIRLQNTQQPLESRHWLFVPNARHDLASKVLP